MNVVEIHNEFRLSTLKVKHLREEVPYVDPAESIKRKMMTVVISDGPRHILRRPRAALLDK